jgi:predicted metalloprotease
MGQFVAVILATTEDVWHRIFGELGKAYVEPTLVLYTASTATACGPATSSQGGNFYCASDQKIYLDPDSARAQAPANDPLGEYLMVWLIARGASEHVQSLLGDANDERPFGSLQADCLVGIWAKSVEGDLFEPGDFAALSKAMDGAAERDARPQKPGAAAERVRWLERGYASALLDDCRMQ